MRNHVCPLRTPKTDYLEHKTARAEGDGKALATDRTATGKQVLQ